MSRNVYRFVILLIVFSTFSISSLAQSTTATLSGTVTDEKGAVVAGASVKITNPATNFQKTVTTDASGKFFLAQLPPATYSLKVENTGFSPSEVKNVELNVNDQRTLNIELKVGNVGGTVQVTDEPTLIDESASVGTTVNRQFVQNLPLNGRSFQSLFELTPGVVLTPSGDGGQGQFSVNGQRTNSNYITVDGVGANVSAAEPILSYELDRLFRSARRPPNVELRSDRAEAGRILLTSSGHDGVSPDDRAYLIQQVGATTGLAAADAERRVDNGIANARAALNRSRRSTVVLAFSLATALLLGAVAAWAAACAGGRHRDGSPLPEWMVHSEKMARRRIVIQ